MIVIGVAATRSGATPDQLAGATELILAADQWCGVTELHHGDCLGGDADLDAVACGLGVRRVAHPPTNPDLRAFCRAEEVLPPEEYKARDRAIVLACGFLIACPLTQRELPFGGTWYTVRFARSLGRPLAIVRPDGRIDLERVPNAGFGTALIVAKERVNYRLPKP